MIPQKKYRNEWKYICSDQTLQILEKRLCALMQPDEHGREDHLYEIHSLYFDDHKDTCAKENNAGVSKRYKYRIRYYGRDLNTLKLEKKEKLHGRCHKESVPLTLEQYQMICEGRYGDLLWMTTHPVLVQFCVLGMTKHLAPKVIIDYERKAYVEPITNIRITFDTNISASREIRQFLTCDYLKIPIQTAGQQVLEVKFDGILPGYLRHALTTKDFIQTSFSKYYLGRICLRDNYHL